MEKTQLQKTVTLSTSEEAEFVSLMEFVKQDFMI